jgi:hypothetical protein
MNVSEANATATLLRFLLDGMPADPARSDAARADAAFLTERVHKTLGAGLRGPDITAAWPTTLTAEIKEAPSMDRRLISIGNSGSGEWSTEDEDTDTPPTCD